MSDKKASLRRLMLDKRLAVKPSIRKSADEEIVAKILSEFGGYTCYHLYNSIKGEVDLSRLTSILVGAGKQVYMPSIEVDRMLFKRYQDAESLVKGKYDILEPCGETASIDDAASLIVVPALAFSSSLQRLGYGKGYYDRYLSEHQRLIKLGVCYDFQIVDELPFDDFDIPVELLITEQRILRRIQR